MWAILALGSAVFVSIKDVFAKSLLNQKVKPVQMAFEEAFLMAVFVLALFFYHIRFSITTGMIILFFCKVAILISAIYLFFTLLKKYEVSIISPLTNLSPVFLIILSYLFLSEKISFIQLGGIVLIIMATFYLEITIKHHDKDNPHKHHLSHFKKVDSFFLLKVVLLLICMSFAAILDKAIFATGLNVYTNIFFTYGLMLGFIVVYFLFKKCFRESVTIMVKRPAIALDNFFGMISSYLILFAIAMPTAFLSLVIPLRRTSTLMSSLLGGMLFHEKHLKKKMYSIVFMILGVFLIAL